MKLGPVKTGQGDYLKCSIPDSLSYLLSGCLTHSQSFRRHQELSWTTAYMSPQRCMQEDLATMRFESHFKSYFGNVKAFNFKILKLSLSPSPQWPEAACGWGAMAGEFLRQSLGRSVFGNESFESIPETSRSSVETCTCAI